MMHCSIEFKQESSPYSYSISDMGNWIRIRLVEEIEGGCNVTVINSPPDIIHSYNNGYKKEEFLYETDIFARVEGDHFIIEADEMAGHKEFGRKRARIPLNIWEAYVALAKKAETIYTTK